MLTRSLEHARAAYQAGDAEGSRQAHQAGPAEKHQQEQGRYIKSIVYGGLDGIITTFAVVAGVEGASLAPAVVLILGAANLVADGLSMAIGDFLSTRSEQEYARAERAREAWEIDNYPDGEKRELIELYVGKGLAPEDARTMVDALAHSRSAWLDVMMAEELGILSSDESPLKNALATFCSFALFGFVPLLTPLIFFFVQGRNALSFGLSCGLTALTLFILGAAKSRFTLRRWWVSGAEMLLVGGAAAAAAYGVGYALAGLQP